MRRLAASLLALACAGCGPDGHPAGYVPDDAEQAQAEADIALANQKAPPPAVGASGAASGTVATFGEEGRISPIPAFHGGDTQWTIDIQSVGDLRHEVSLRQGDAHLQGRLNYRPVPGTGADGPFDLDGALYMPQGDAVMHVHLERDPCVDAKGAHGWKIQVYVDGQAPRDGCGDIAM